MKLTFEEKDFNDFKEKVLLQIHPMMNRKREVMVMLFANFRGKATADNSRKKRGKDER